MSSYFLEEEKKEKERERKFKHKLTSQKLFANTILGHLPLMITCYFLVKSVV